MRNFLDNLIDFLDNFLDYFYYRKCYFCWDKAEFGVICHKCFEHLKSQKTRKVKYIKSVPIVGFFTYKDEVKRLIRGIKYYKQKALAAPAAQLLIETANFSDDMELVPVPLHENRQKYRRYNHTELIASHMGIPVNTKIIKRIKDTKPQYNLTSRQRQDNLKGAFKVYPEEYTGKKLILFDDICTTGATMEEIIRELRENGITNVVGLVICFTPDF